MKGQEIKGREDDGKEGSRDCIPYVESSYYCIQKMWLCKTKGKFLEKKWHHLQMKINEGNKKVRFRVTRTDEDRKRTLIKNRT